MSYLVNQQSQQGKEPLEFTDIMESTNDDIPKISSITQVSSFFDKPSLDWACLTMFFLSKELVWYGKSNSKINCYNNRNDMHYVEDPIRHYTIVSSISGLITLFVFN